MHEFAAKDFRFVHMLASSKSDAIIVSSAHDNFCDCFQRDHTEIGPSKFVGM